MDQKTNGQLFKEKIHRYLQSSGMKKFKATLMAIGIGLLLGFIVMLISKPGSSFNGLIAMLFGGIPRLDDVLFFMVPVLMTGLSVGFAFKMGLFNIGASGQYTMGMFFALYVGFMFPMSGSIHWIVAVLGGLIGGLLWGIIPGVLKAYLNVNEVISSIMLNYIGMYLVDFFIQNNGTMYSTGYSRTKYLPESVQLASFGAGTNVNIGLIIGIVIAIVIGLIMYKTTFGYELIATGHSKDASKYAGINYKRNTVFAMGIAGALAGLGGALMILAPSIIVGSSMTYSPVNEVASAGFNGIAVALLGNSNPFGIIFSALFISYIQRGGTAAAIAGYKPEIVDVVISIIIYFSAFALVINQTIANFIKNRHDKVDRSIGSISEPIEEGEVA